MLRRTIHLSCAYILACTLGSSWTIADLRASETDDAQLGIVQLPPEPPPPVDRQQILWRAMQDRANPDTTAASPNAEIKGPTDSAALVKSLLNDDANSSTTPERPASELRNYDLLFSEKLPTPTPDMMTSTNKESQGIKGNVERVWQAAWDGDTNTLAYYAGKWSGSVLFYGGLALVFYFVYLRKSR